MEYLSQLEHLNPMLNVVKKIGESIVAFANCYYPFNSTASLPSVTKSSRPVPGSITRP